MRDWEYDDHRDYMCPPECQGCNNKDVTIDGFTKKMSDLVDALYGEEKISLLNLHKLLQEVSHYTDLYIGDEKMPHIETKSEIRRDNDSKSL